MNPTNFQLLADVNKSQLLVIDVQTRLTPVMSDAGSLLRNCRILIESAKLLGVPITVTEQYPKGIGHTHEEIVEKLGADYRPVEKTCFSCCGSEDFNVAIGQHKDRQQFLLCGIEAHVCILQTASDLMSLHADSQVFIIADAVDSRSEKNKNVALSRLQTGAIITCTESVVFEWMKNSSSDHFKHISTLIR